VKCNPVYTIKTIEARLNYLRVNAKPLIILLADDDMDDCLFFKEAVEELSLPAQLSTIHDGEQLMRHLNDETNELLDVLFLDLNMPRKNGFECLSEIKGNQRLKQLPVIIFSTSFEQGVVNLLYKNGAQYFLRKPSEFLQFKKIIHQTINTFIIPQNISQPTRENFVLNVQNSLIV
jgi:CheY-like chemotaxis protein